MKIKALLLLGVVATAAFVGIAGAGCSKSSGGSPTGSSTGTPTGTGSPTPSGSSAIDGFVFLFLTSGSTQAVAAADFVTSSGQVTSQVTPVTVNTCYVPSPTPTPKFVSVGPTMTYTVGASTITLTEIPGATGHYDAFTAPTVFANTSYSVAITGSAGIAAQTFVDALVMPKLISAPKSFTGITTNPVTWTSVGAQFVTVTFTHQGTGAIDGVCNAADTGTFTVPASFLSTLGQNGGVYFGAENLAVKAGPVSGESAVFLAQTISGTATYSK